MRTAEEDWFFKTDDLVAEELRKVETDKKFLAVDDSKLDLAEMAFALVMRKVRQEDSEELSLRRQALEARSKIADAEVDEQALETHTELRKETCRPLSASTRSPFFGMTRKRTTKWTFVPRTTLLSSQSIPLKLPVPILRAIFNK